MSRSVAITRWRQVIGNASLVAALLGLVGCTGKSSGTVSGKVTYKGNPVASGSVNFYNPGTGAAAEGKLDDNGAYTLPGPLDAGTYKVYLQPPIPEQLPPGQKAKKRAPFTVPPKYQTASNTPISKEVKVGNNDIPITLE